MTNTRDKPWMLRKYSDLRRRYKEGAVGRSFFNVVSQFPVYTPSGAGDYTTRAALTMLAINQTVENLRVLAAEHGRPGAGETDVNTLVATDNEHSIALAIKDRLDHYGSDKGNPNHYHMVYGKVFADIGDLSSMLEIGLGSNNTDVFSNMGKRGKPGASLRAFRDFFPRAMVYGADVDKRILFEDERIKTFYVDQTDKNTLNEIGDAIPGELDLVIDDGLHATNANLATLTFGLLKIRIGGWVVIEDITYEAKPIWEVVSSVLDERYQAHLIRTPRAYVFATKRLA